MLFKFSNLTSNIALTLGYRNPALNNSAQRLPGMSVELSYVKKYLKTRILLKIF